MRISFKGPTRAYLAIVLSLSLCLSGFGQGTSPAGIRGIVTDPSGARIPGATIQLHGPAGDQTQTADANGEYTFTALTPGSYDVEVMAPDFKVDKHPGVN